MNKPSIDKWLEEAKADPMAHMCGSYLTHSGVVRKSPKAAVRGLEDTDKLVSEMRFSCNQEAIAAAADEALRLPGIYFVKIWVNQGRLKVGDDIMQLLVGGDIRPHAMDALNFLLSEIKNNCVKEEEIY